jgi:hypothetical protein
MSTKPPCIYTPPVVSLLYRFWLLTPIIVDFLHFVLASYTWSMYIDIYQVRIQWICKLETMCLFTNFSILSLTYTPFQVIQCTHFTKMQFICHQSSVNLVDMIIFFLLSLKFNSLVVIY